MLDVRLFGRFRKFSPQPRLTGNSKLSLEYKEGETIRELLGRIGIDPNDVGEIFINFTPIFNLEEVIPEDGSRIGIFPKGFALFEGASHLAVERDYSKKGITLEYF